MFDISIWPIDETLLLRVKVNLEVMAKKGFSTFPKDQDRILVIG